MYDAPCLLHHCYALLHHFSLVDKLENVHKEQAEKNNKRIKVKAELDEMEKVSIFMHPSRSHG